MGWAWARFFRPEKPGLFRPSPSPTRPVKCWDIIWRENLTNQHYKKLPSHSVLTGPGWPNVWRLARDRELYRPRTLQEITKSFSLPAIVLITKCHCMQTHYFIGQLICSYIQKLDVFENVENWNAHKKTPFRFPISKLPFFRKAMHQKLPRSWFKHALYVMWQR
jgi:hypothetical protein